MVKKNRNNSETSCMYVIRNDDGLNEENNLKERWKNYFKNILECEYTVADDNVTATEYSYMHDDGNDREIMTDQIMKELKRIRVGKAAGYDRVSTERVGRGIVASLLFQLFNKCWKSHRVPNDWCKAVTVPLYKEKGSRQVYTNHRPISLLSVFGNLYSKIIIERVVNETENKTWDVRA
ncbi:hypothetical protein EVAR_75291_1 [Eumeta japonica]|uniref:Reverse transcriptase domain-containing protein n=1 Tax=Eumeta variegata TaxID=151549 RepID=A0A4C1YZ81_EUMVA|nr:hypothetical protein EVAR_75291_1 [Eumeta japonica]